MKNLADEIDGCRVADNELRFWWLGQAGFAFKGADGKVTFLDPYLSDAVERLYAFKRMSLPPVAPEDVRADRVIVTHEHADHFDPDTIPVIARNNPECLFAGAQDCEPHFKEAGIPAARCTGLERQGVVDFDGLTVHTVPADHGDLAPLAVGLLLDFGGVRVLYPGDTALRHAVFQPLYDLEPDILLPPINGNFGNMNHIDAAMMTQAAKPRIVVPCHFWTFVEHGGDPAGFLYACGSFCPDTRVVFLTPGEGMTYEGRPAE